MPNLKKILIWGLCIFLGVLTLWGFINLSIYWKWITENIFWSRVINLSKWFLIVGAGSLLVIFIIYIKDKGKDTVEPKKIVDTDTAIKIAQEEFIKKNGIPHYMDYSQNKEGVIRLTRLRDLMFRNPTTYSHPISGVPFLQVEAVAMAGSNRGTNLMSLKLDEGEEKIHNNFFYRFLRKTSHETYKVDRNFPISTSADQSNRDALEQFKLLQEGETTQKEIKQFNEIKQQQMQNKPAQQPLQITDELQESLIEQQKIQNALNMQKMVKR